MYGSWEFPSTDFFGGTLIRLSEWGGGTFDWIDFAEVRCAPHETSEEISNEMYGNIFPEGRIVQFIFLTTRSTYTGSR